MSKFKVGDKVKVVDTGGDNNAVRNEVVTVIDADDPDRLIRVQNAIGKTYTMFDHRFELVESGEDFEAKYNALVADLLEAYRVGLPARYVRENLLPKPKQYDVTLRITDPDIGKSLAPGQTYRGWNVQSVTEVTQ